LKIPSTLKTTFEDTFYDKTITTYSISEQIDDEGWAKTEDVAVTGTFMGNVNFSNLEKLQLEYGLEDKVDVSITTSTNIPTNNIVSYGGFQYKIVKAMPFDTHYLLIGTKWSSKSSISLSA
jgi:hypothetical protein